MSHRRFFITGTDTGVGKTLITGALLLGARELGWQAVGVKPLSAGCVRQDGQLVNEDALLLQRCASLKLPYAAVNPVALELPIAPHLAALHMGINLRVQPLVQAVEKVAEESVEVLLVEGVGGWLVPLNAAETMAEVAQSLAYPVILVVALQLGCLNHALLTVRAIEASGLALAGWVANTVAPGMLAAEETLAALEQRVPGLRLGTVPYLGPSVTPEQASTWLDARSLFGDR